MYWQGGGLSTRKVLPAMTALMLSEEEYVEICAKKAAYEARMHYRQLLPTAGESPQTQPKQRKLLTRPEAAELLGRSESYLRKLESKGFIQRARESNRRKIVYTLEEVERCKSRLDA